MRRTSRATPAFLRWRELVLSLLACATSAHAADAYREEAVKAAFIYRFTGYVEWPPASLDGAPAFTIAVLGSPGVARELARFAVHRPIRNLPVMVRRIESVAQADGAHVLYVGPEFSGSHRSLVKAVGNRPVLLITDSPRGLDDGSVLNFVLVDRRVRFEVSLAAAQRAGIRLSSELLSVATRVLEISSRPDRCRFGDFGTPPAGCEEQLARHPGAGT
jgi:hypothetical protein